MRKKMLVIVIFGLALLMAGITAQGSTVLFSDNFQSPITTVPAWDQNVDVAYPGRQAGTLAPLTYDSFYYSLTPQQKIDWNFYSLTDGMLLDYGGGNTALNFFTYNWDALNTNNLGINHNFNGATKLQVKATLMPDDANLNWSDGFNAYMYLTVGQNATWLWPANATTNIPNQGLTVVLRNVMELSHARECDVYYNGAQVASFSPTADNNGNYSSEWTAVIDLDVPAWDGSTGTANVRIVDYWQWSQPAGRSFTVLTNYPVAFTNNYVGVSTYADAASGNQQPNYLDNVVITASSPSLDGSIILGSFLGSTWLTPIGIEWMQDSTVVRTDRVFLNPDGTYAVYGVAPGTYNVRISAAGFLSQTTSDVVVADGITQHIIKTLVNGDINGDNTISVLDKNILSGNINQAGN